MDGGAFLNLASALCSYDLSSLHTVDLSQNHLSGAEAGMALARILSHAKSVRFLSLGWNRLLLSDLCPIISANEKALASTSQTYEIECLDLRANPLTPVLKRSSKKSTKHRSVHKECGDEFIGALVASMPNLTHIQLAQATIGDRELISLLRSLTRPGSRVEYVGLEWLGLGSRLSALREMLGNMASGDMTSAAATVAHPLVAVHLNLSANNLGDSGVEVITSSGAVLQSLTLACNFITERGTGLLAEWLPQSGLRLLDLSDNYFGDQGIVS
ncbi:NACHT, LRR and PYD domains-containing protein 13, partial [Coemansia sp. RSA 2320]